MLGWQGEESLAHASVRDVLSVLRECHLLDSEFVVLTEDGFVDRFWSITTPKRDLYAPASSCRTRIAPKR